VSVTYGAGGSTRELTHELVLKLIRETSFTVVSHLTCVDATVEETHRILDTYSEAGVENIMALRGDPPEGERTFAPVPGGFTFAAELVAHIKRHFPHLGVGVAGFPEGHPATPNRLDEIDYLRAKVDAGVDYICTQLFFDNRDFYDFVERCRHAGIEVPIVAGIMPITSAKGMRKMASLAAGSRFPAPLLKAIDRAGTHEGEEYIENVGIHWATQQVLDLIEHGVDGIHFYTLNKSKATQRIYESLGLQLIGREDTGAPAARESSGARRQLERAR
ncbi:MAG: methylenetetrahydrofolate reductase, partial [Spirochaetaceae bacterium]